MKNKIVLKKEKPNLVRSKSIFTTRQVWCSAPWLNPQHHLDLCALLGVKSSWYHHLLFAPLRAINARQSPGQWSLNETNVKDTLHILWKTQKESIPRSTCSSILLYWCASPWECLWSCFSHTSPEPANTTRKHHERNPLQSSHSSVPGNSWELCKTSLSHSILATLDGVCLCGKEER